MVLLQLVGVLFAVVMLYITYFNYKRKDLTLRDLWSWGALWILLIILILFPDVASFVFEPLSVQGALQFIILVSIGVLFLAVFNNYLLLKKNQRKLTEIISKVAIKKHHDGKESKKNHDR